MPSFFRDRSMSISQAFSAERAWMAALLITETKSTVSAMSKWSNLWSGTRTLVVTGMVGVNSRSRSACILTYATQVSLQNRLQSVTSAGLCTVGATSGMGTSVQSRTHCPQNRSPIISLSRSRVSYLAFNHAIQSRRDSSLNDTSVSWAPIPLSICQAINCSCPPSAVAIAFTIRRL